MANAFVYLVRYGISDWAPVYLQEMNIMDASQSNLAFSLHNYAGVPGTIICGWISAKFFKGRCAPANVIYMGDDIPDLECMREVGIPVCPADAAAEVIEASRYVSEFRGGEGAVRDIVEQVLRARGDWAKNSEGVTPSSLAASR